MKVEAGIGSGWLGRVQGEARRLESLGYDGLLTVDFSHEVSMNMTLAAAATERIEIGSAVMIAFARSPFVVAQQAWELQELSRGRINLGLGSQVKGHNERRFSSGKWVPPAPRLQEYVQMVRAVWDTFQTGARPSFSGKYYQFTLCPRDYNPGSIPYPAPKIMISAVGPAMARVAGRVCDGVRIHPFNTRRWITEVLIPNVREGARQAGRNLDGFELCGAGMIALGETESEAEHNLEKLRPMIAFYASTRTYHSMLAMSGFESVGMQLHEMSLRNEWEKMPAVIPEEMLHEVGIMATYDNLPDLLRTKFGYLSRTSLAYAGTEPKDPERLRHLIGAIQKVETAGIMAAA